MCVIRRVKLKSKDRAGERSVGVRRAEVVEIGESRPKSQMNHEMFDIKSERKRSSVRSGRVRLRARRAARP